MDRDTSRNGKFRHASNRVLPEASSTRASSTRASSTRASSTRASPTFGGHLDLAGGLWPGGSCRYPGAKTPHRCRSDTVRNLVLPLDAGGEYKVFYLDPDGTRHEIADAEIYS